MRESPGRGVSGVLAQVLGDSSLLEQLSICRLVHTLSQPKPFASALAILGVLSLRSPQTFPSGDESADLMIHNPTEISAFFYVFFLLFMASLWDTTGIWFHSDLHPN